MANALLNALRRNLERAEQLGDTDRAKLLKTRIADEEKTAEQVEDFGERNVADILAEVGDDPDLAAAALDAENAKEKPRKTLVSGLESVITASEED